MGGSHRKIHEPSWFSYLLGFYVFVNVMFGVFASFWPWMFWVALIMLTALAIVMVGYWITLYVTDPNKQE
jgi:hypothetical protein